MVKKSLQYLKRTLTKPKGLDPGSVYPVSEWLGEDRGSPIDRYYIEEFLNTHRDYIRGNTLEVANNKYTRKFGSGEITMDVLNPDPGSPGATIIGDLTNSNSLP